MKNQNEVMGVDFISSYAGIQSYMIRTRSGSHRVETHFPESDYHRSISCYKDADYEKYVISKIGCYTGSPEMLTLEMAVDFNRHRFEFFDGQVSTILSNPERYGEYDPLAPENTFTVFLPATFSERHGWTALYSFEQIRDLAGIPVNRATSLYKAVVPTAAGESQAA